MSQPPGGHSATEPKVCQLSWCRLTATESGWCRWHVESGDALQWLADHDDIASFVR